MYNDYSVTSDMSQVTSQNENMQKKKQILLEWAFQIVHSTA